MLTKRVRRALGLSLLLFTILVLVFIFDLWFDVLSPSLQERLPLHPTTPVVVDVKLCSTTMFDNCTPKDSKWHKIDKDLLLGSSWIRKQFLLVKYVPETELEQGQKVVIALDAGPQQASKSEFESRSKLPKFVSQSFLDSTVDLQSSGWKCIDESLRLWVQYARHMPNKAVTDIKVLFGDEVSYPIPQWSITEQGLGSDPETGARLVFKIGRPQQLVKPQLKINNDGKFKLVQLSDLHYSTKHGECSAVSELLPQQNTKCRADLLTSNFVHRVLDLEEPDLAVFSGDLILGENCPDPETALLKALDPVLERNIPFAVIWGNHDRDGTLRNDELMDIVESLPNSLSERGPEDVAGFSNYVIRVLSNGYPALSLYFLDTHAKLPKSRLYDCIAKDQNEFIRSEARKTNQQLTSYSHIPLAMGFIHIPLPEYRDDMVKVGEHRENVIGPSNDEGSLDAFKDANVHVVNAGHDHANSFCGLHDRDIWLCYAGGMGYGGYGGYPNDRGEVYRRRARVFEIDVNVGSIETWHRVDGEGDIEKFKLIDNGETTK